MQNIGNSIRSMAIALAFGMKGAETEMFASTSSPMSKEIIQQKQSNALQDILEGKLTKQVQEYRYRHYLILRETSKKMRAKERREIHHLKVDPYDSYVPELGLLTKNTGAGMFENNQQHQYSNIIVENFSTNIPIEKYSSKVVVRDINGEHKLLEMWFEKGQLYSREGDYILKELNTLIMNPQITPLTNISKVAFVTQNAYGVDDFLYYEYQIKSLYKIVEYNNHYILKYVAKPLSNGEDVLKNKFYDSDVEQQVLSEKIFKIPTQSKVNSGYNNNYEQLMLENERLKKENEMYRNRDFI